MVIPSEIRSRTKKWSDKQDLNPVVTQRSQITPCFIHLNDQEQIRVESNNGCQEKFPEGEEITAKTQ